MNAAIWESAQPPSGCSFAPRALWENIAHLLITKHPPVSYKSPWKPWSDWNTIRLPIKGPLWSLFRRKLDVTTWCPTGCHPHPPPLQKTRENSPGRPRLGTNPGEAPGIFLFQCFPLHGRTPGDIFNDCKCFMGKLILIYSDWNGTHFHPFLFCWKNPSLWKKVYIDGRDVSTIQPTVDHLPFVHDLVHVEDHKLVDTWLGEANLRKLPFPSVCRASFEWKILLSDYCKGHVLALGFRSRFN